jgi:adenosylmethionine-8-amino-7-oxononanoate aminotransferase
MSQKSSVFNRSRKPPRVAVSAVGAWITDEDGKQYLDAAGGAIASLIGHGDPAVAAAMATQAETLEWAHAAAFTTGPVEAYASAVSALVPMDEAHVFPVSGGSEAIETALKMARAYHLARGEPDRSVVIARGASYHGNTRGALDVSGREPLQRPYEPWLGQTVRVPAVTEYRCSNPGHPIGCARFHAERLEEAISTVGPERVAAFVAEPVGGATSGAAVPPDGYWDEIARVCRAHGVLVIADEVMTGFGRTGEWFASNHFGLRPDILVAAKGASSGYWPLGLAIADGSVHTVIEEGGGLVHGFTWSHHPVGAAVGLAVLNRLVELRLIDRARTTGEKLMSRLQKALGENELVGDVRGIGLLICVDMVQDRASRKPFPRSEQVTEQILDRAMELGLLLYPSTGTVDGTDGDYLLIGPPLSILDDEADLIVDRLTAALDGIR